MKNYEKHIEDWGKELADEVVKKMRNPKFTPFLEKLKIAQSLSTIHDTSVMEVMEDLEKSISREVKRILESN